ncbi:unnamed protein product [Orchesella dallaii]|uniref:Uncharacterized protein n=1 Tax=Orchesella dallaii TaxID=48710 RepID=A0ABP1S9V7_9HEXA
MSKRPRVGDRVSPPLTRGQSRLTGQEPLPQTDIGRLERGSSKVKSKLNTLSHTLASFNPFGSTRSPLPGTSTGSSNPFFRTPTTQAPSTPSFPEPQRAHVDFRPRQRRRLPITGEEDSAPSPHVSREYIQQHASNPYYASTGTPNLEVPESETLLTPSRRTTLKVRFSEIDENLTDMDTRRRLLTRKPEEQLSPSQVESESTIDWANKAFLEEQLDTPEQFKFEQYRTQTEEDSLSESFHSPEQKEGRKWSTDSSSPEVFHRRFDTTFELRDFKFGEESFLKKAQTASEQEREYDIPPSDDTEVFTARPTTDLINQDWLADELRKIAGDLSADIELLDSIIMPDPGTPGTPPPKASKSSPISSMATVVMPSVYLQGLQYTGSEPPTAFIEALDTLALVNRWDEKGKRCSLLFHLQGAAKDCYNNHITDLMELHDYDTKEELFSSSHEPTYDKMCDWLRTSFSVRETPEVLQRELREIKYVNFPSAAMYFHQAVRLMNRIDRSMSEQKRIGHLIKGIPEDIALKVYLMQPKTTMEVLEFLNQNEKFASLYHRKETHNLEVDLKKMMTSFFTQHMKETRQEMNNLLVQGRLIPAAKAEGSKPKPKVDNPPQQVNQGNDQRDSRRSRNRGQWQNRN